MNVKLETVSLALGGGCLIPIDQNSGIYHKVVVSCYVWCSPESSGVDLNPSEHLLNHELNSLFEQIV